MLYVGGTLAVGIAVVTWKYCAGGSAQQVDETSQVAYRAMVKKIRGVPTPGPIGKEREWLNDPSNRPLLRAVHWLVLSEHRLQVLPQEVRLFDHLKTLSIWGNQLRTLPPAIGDLKALENLWVSNNLLETLPPDIGRLTRLASLQIRRNHLRSLPDQIGNLTSLGELDAAHNRLSTLPDTVGSLESLSRVNLSFNELTCLPETIGNWRSVSLILVKGNKLTTVPSAIGACVQLHELVIFGNPISYLPNEIAIPALAQASEEWLRSAHIKPLLPESFIRTKEAVEESYDKLHAAAQQRRDLLPDDTWWEKFCQEKRTFNEEILLGVIPSGELKGEWPNPAPSAVSVVSDSKSKCPCDNCTII